MTEDDKSQEESDRFEWLKTANQLAVLDIRESQAISDDVRTEISLLSRKPDAELSPAERSLIRKSARLGTAIGSELLADPDVRLPQPDETLWEEWEWTIGNMASAAKRFGEAHRHHHSATIRDVTDQTQMPPLRELLADRQALEDLLRQLHTAGVIVGHSGDDISRGRMPREQLGREAVALISILGRQNAGLKLKPQSAHDLYEIHYVADHVKQGRLAPTPEQSEVGQ